MAGCLSELQAAFAVQAGNLDITAWHEKEGPAGKRSSSLRNSWNVALSYAVKQDREPAAVLHVQADLQCAESSATKLSIQQSGECTRRSPSSNGQPLEQHALGRCSLTPVSGLATMRSSNFSVVAALGLCHSAQELSTSVPPRAPAHALQAAHRPFRRILFGSGRVDDSR